MRNSNLPAFLELSTPKMHLHACALPHAGDDDILARPLVSRVREADFVARPILAGDRVAAAAEPKRRPVLEHVQHVGLGQSQGFHLPNGTWREPDSWHLFGDQSVNVNDERIC